MARSRAKQGNARHRYRVKDEDGNVVKERRRVLRGCGFELVPVTRGRVPAFSVRGHKRRAWMKEVWRMEAQRKEAEAALHSDNDMLLTLKGRGF